MPDTRAQPGGDDLDHLIGRLYRYALAIRHDPAAAEDAVHDALVRVCEKGGPWDEAYLRRAVRHRAMDSVKSDSRRIRRERERTPVRSDAEFESHSDEGDADLAAALSSLRPIEREAIYLAVVEGLATKHVAAAMGRPRGSVLSLIHRAKLRLGEALAHAAGNHGHE